MKIKYGLKQSAEENETKMYNWNAVRKTLINEHGVWFICDIASSESADT